MDKKSYTFEDFRNIISELRSEHGCPWDREQTYESMKKPLLDEVQEVTEAVEHEDMENLCEELGDVLLNVALYVQIAAERGDFTMEDVSDGVCEKLIRRHPHVFGDKKALTPEEGLNLWNEIKSLEKQSKK